MLGQTTIGEFTDVLELTDDDRFLYVGEFFNRSIRGFELGADGLPIEPGTTFPAAASVIGLIAPPGTSRLYQMTRDLRSVLTFTIDPDRDLSPVGQPVVVADSPVPNGAAYLGPRVRTVAIDIKPDGFPNRVNPFARGVLPVAILGSDSFDVTTIAVTELRFGPEQAGPAHDLTDAFTLNDHRQDVDLDGYLDLVTHFRVRDTGIVCGDDSAMITGETTGGQSFEGSDSIDTVGCRSSRRPGLWRDKPWPPSPRSGGLRSLGRNPWVSSADD